MIDEILLAREKRIIEIQKHLSAHYSTLLIKANIPGEDKNRFEAHFLVRHFLNHIQTAYHIIDIKSYESADGPYVIMHVMNIHAQELKINMIEIEDNEPLGRFIDLDVFEDTYISISRIALGQRPRKCFLCNLDASICARSHNHRYDELIRHIETSVTQYILDQTRIWIQKAIKDELNLDPKFGLVTPLSNGSHEDMNYALMQKASSAIEDDLIEIFRKGFDSNHLDGLLSSSRPIGIRAEKNMLSATGGINAYKGLIFILGIVLLSSGYTIRHNQSFDMIFENIKTISKDIYQDFENGESSAGIDAYRNYGLKGIRGEVKNGCPSIQSALKMELKKKNPLHQLLMHLIIISEDTVFLKRAESLDRYLSYKDMIRMLDSQNINELNDFTSLAIKNHLSFGGSADLLICTLFLKSFKTFLK